MSLLYFCIALVVLVAVNRAEKSDTNLVKTYDQPDGYKLRVYSDGKDVVMGLFDDNDHPVYCKYQQGNTTLISGVFYDAIAKQTSHQMIQMTDVRKVIRSCKRFTRKVLRWTPDEKDPGNFKEAKLRHRLLKGISGTSWCSIHGYQQERGSDVDDLSTDKCCKKLHSCNATIPGWTIKHQYFNFYPWPLFHCNCTEKFHSCLTQSKGPLKDEVGGLYFNTLKLRCYQTEEEKTCSTWEEWYKKCQTFVKTSSIRLKENARF